MRRKLRRNLRKKAYCPEARISKDFEYQNQHAKLKLTMKNKLDAN